MKKKLHFVAKARNYGIFVAKMYDYTLFTRPLLQKGSSLQEEILCVCVCVCLSVITFSFFKYSII